MSIFTKTCPRCAADNAAEAERCACGYVFDGDVTSNSYAAIELALQEAELYAEYLKARLRQTREAAEVAAADAERSPGDTDKAQRAEEARAEYTTAKSEYKTQKDQIADLQAEAKVRHERENAAAQKLAWEQARKKAAEQAAADAKAAKQAVAAAKAAADAEATKAAAKAKAAADAKAAKKAAAAAKKAAKKATKIPAEAARQAMRPSVSLQQKLARKAQQAIERVRGVGSEPKEIQTAPTAPRSAAKPVPAPVSRKAVAPKPQPSPATTPSPQPVQVQPGPPKKATPVETKKPSPKTIECPHCTAVLPIGTQRCRCGFTFNKTSDAMPGIGLTSEEQARLLSLFQPDKN